MVISQSPAVGVETLLQGPWERGFRSQRVVHWQDGDTKVLGPALQIGLNKTENKIMPGWIYEWKNTHNFTVNIFYVVKFMRNNSSHNKRQGQGDREKKKCGGREMRGLWTLRSEDEKLWKLCVPLMSSVCFLSWCLDKGKMSVALMVTSISFLLFSYSNNKKVPTCPSWLWRKKIKTKEWRGISGIDCTNKLPVRMLSDFLSLLLQSG